MFKKLGSIIKFPIAITLSLVSFSLLADSHLPQKKIFELDLTNENISPEGAGIEVYKNKKNCTLKLELYGTSGQEKYSFIFKENKLIKTSYLKYRYKYGLLVVDDDLKDLIADAGQSKSSNDMDLIKNKVFLGKTNTYVTKNFDIYIKKVPKKVLISNCK